jgi:hypothetical protein
MGEIFWIDGLWLVYRAISTIYTDLTHITLTIHKPILPINLMSKNRLVTVHFKLLVLL